MNRLLRFAASALLLFPLALSAQTPPPLSSAEKRQIVTHTAAAIEKLFLDEERGRVVAEDLRRRNAAGEFDRAGSRQELAEAVTRAIHSVENDGHLRLMFKESDAGTPLLGEEAFRTKLDESGPIRIIGGPRPGPAGEPEPAPGGAPGPQIRRVIAPEMSPELLEEARRNNFDLRRVRHFEGNVGYFEVNKMHSAEIAGPRVAAIFDFLQDVDAMIIDLRKAPGGAQDMVNLLASYFFPNDGRELITSHMRGARPMVSRVRDVPGKRLENVDLYVVVGEGTFSAGEALAYILQQFGRATVVGEKTLGGGRHNVFVPLGGGFQASVSVGTVKHPKTGTGWQGTGVVPDVKAPVATAVDEALRLALQSLAEKASDSARKQQLLSLAANAKL